MGVAAKPRCTVVFLMVLALGVSLRLPAEDVLDAVYDESEAVPYEVIAPVSIVVSPLSTRTTQAAPISLHQKLGVPSRFSSARVSDTGAKGVTDTRISLALLCTLLC
jgi:hypothetical protein